MSGEERFQWSRGGNLPRDPTDAAFQEVCRGVERRAAPIWPRPMDAPGRAHWFLSRSLPELCHARFAGKPQSENDSSCRWNITGPCGWSRRQASGKRKLFRRAAGQAGKGTPPQKLQTKPEVMSQQLCSSSLGRTHRWQSGLLESVANVAVTHGGRGSRCSRWGAARRPTVFSGPRKEATFHGPFLGEKGLKYVSGLSGLTLQTRTCEYVWKECGEDDARERGGLAGSEGSTTPGIGECECGAG